ncbi:regulatory protein RecX [Pseudomonadota bacterium]
MSERGLKQCRVSAMSLLARREHSQKELHQKLISRDFDEQLVDQTLLELTRENLLSNERFAEAFVKSKVNKGQGPLRISQELSEHGIASELISDYLVDQQWLSLATKARQKRFGSELPNEYKERAKQMRFLQYRGFSNEQINGAMKQSDG